MKKCFAKPTGRLALIGGLFLALVLGGCPTSTDPGSGSDLSAPANVSGLNSSTAAGSVTLSWTDPADSDLDHIEITFSPDTAGIEQPLVAAKGAHTKTISGLTNTQYIFTVKAVDTSGNKNAGKQKTQTVGPVAEGEFEDIVFRYQVTTISGTEYPITAPRFFSLATGLEIDASKSNTTEWDIAIEAKDGGFCYIYTNSGASASRFGSGGQGGVWFTNKTDFDETVFADRVTDFSGGNAEYAAYVTDVTRYQRGMSGSPPPSQMNIMTYYGYASGDGLSADAKFEWSSPGPPWSPFYDFNKKAFAKNLGGMPPPWNPTGQVYVIKLAGEDSYSKFQVNALALYPTSATNPDYRATYVLSFKFGGFDSE